MKRFLLSILLINFLTGVYAQGNQKQDTLSASMEEKLVRLALEHNPHIDILENNRQIALYNLRKDRWSWVNQIMLSGNLNEFTLDQTTGGANTPTQAAFYPRYNISLTVPLGIFGSRPNETKISREELRNSEIEISIKETEIRKQVLTLYENYLLYQKLLIIQNQKTEDEFAYYKSIETKFTTQKVGIEEFKNASNDYNRELERKYTLAYEQKVIKLGLESLIGMTLEEAELAP